MRPAYLAALAVILSTACAHAERVTPPGTWLRMMKQTIRKELGARDWARISSVYVDHIIKYGGNPVCGKVTATLGSDAKRETRLFYGVVAVSRDLKQASLVDFEVAKSSDQRVRIVTRCKDLGLIR